MNNQNTDLPVRTNRNYKDTLFRYIFREPQKLLELYNTINGTEEQPERLEMKLSDAYEMTVSNPALELRVIQLNINVGQNNALMEKCKTLKDYCIFVDRVRKYAKTLSPNKAVEKAIQECIKENILSEFLSNYRAEAISMSIFEYDEEREKELIRQTEREVGHEEGWNAGLTEGRQVGLQQGIEAVVMDNINAGTSKEQILAKLQNFFQLTESDALIYLQKFYS